MSFTDLGLLPRLQDQLAQQGIADPTPIQQKAIPLALEGRDIMGLAQTGTGKTAAFGLPLMHHLLKAGKKPAPKTVRGLILAPTRELAKQIKDNLTRYSKDTHIKCGLVVGGAAINAQINRLSRGTDLLIATPGRLIDLIDRQAVDLSQTKYLVLDEADQMLDLGFIHALRRIAPLLASERQTMLFSATMPKHMAELADTYLQDPVRVEVARPGQVADKVEQSIHYVAGPAKTGLLVELLQDHPDELSIVFARTKHGSERLMKALVREGIKADSVHGNKSQGQRQRAIDALRSGKITVLVATDVAARGLDIPDVRFVYNYDLPNVPENYVHRIGRTARAGRDGRAIAFCAPDEMGSLKDVEKVLKMEIPVASGRRWDNIEGPSGKKPRKKTVRGRGAPRRDEDTWGDAKPWSKDKPKGGGKPKFGGKPKGDRKPKEGGWSPADDGPSFDGPKKKNGRKSKPEAADAVSIEKPKGKPFGKPKGKPKGKPQGKRPGKPAGNPKAKSGGGKRGGGFDTPRRRSA